MIPVATFTPDDSTSQQVNLLLQSGWTEVINDSNFLLIVQNQNGSCYQVPGIAMLYPTPAGGGSIYISPQPIDSYLFGDAGLSNNVVVNQYLDGELPPSVSYPYSLIRSAAVTINAAQQIHAAAFASAMSQGLTATISSPSSSFDVGYMYLCGLDLTIDQEATAHGYTLQVQTIGSEQIVFEYVFHSNTTTSTQLIRTFDPPLRANVSGSTSQITASVAPVTGATARGALNIYGVFQ